MVAGLITFVYGIILMFVLSNNEPKEEVNDNKQEAKELDIIDKEDKQKALEEKMVKIEESNKEDLLNEKYNKAKFSKEFYLLIMAISYSISVTFFYKNNKKAVGINHFDDQTMTYLSIPTSI